MLMEHSILTLLQPSEIQRSVFILLIKSWYNLNLLLDKPWFVVDSTATQITYIAGMIIIAGF